MVGIDECEVGGCGNMTTSVTCMDHTIADTVNSDEDEERGFLNYITGFLKRWVWS